LALAIVTLSAAAGWASGQRTAQMNATATQNAAINEQISRIELDVTNRNLPLLQARIKYLATLTPGVPGLNDFVQTATAVYVISQPTPTLPPSATPAPTQTPAAATQQTIATQPPVNATLTSLPALLEQAKSAAAVSDWKGAAQLLDVIISTDKSFEATTVRGLMLQALTSEARKLYRAGSVGDLAEASVLTDRAKQFGDVGDLSYEQLVAGLYLDALNTIGTSYPASIAALLKVYSQAPTYRDVARLLSSQYAAYGDAFVAEAKPCDAVFQYQNALGITNDPGITAKRDSAQTACSQQPAPGLTPGTPGTIAPIGVPGT
jgi:hypothetical protein